MYKNKKILAIIPARSGSKGLKDKNIKPLLNKPLLAWSIESAKKSKYLDYIVLNTDSKEYAKIGKEYNINTFIRPKHLALDTTTSVDVVLHHLEYLEKNNLFFDYFILLEPTSPIREDDDIDNMIELLLDSNYTSLSSIGEVSTHPSIVKKIENNKLVPFCKELKLTSRRQDNEEAFFPYGVGYLVNVNTFKEEKTFYTKDNYFYKIKRHQCYEIDDIYDFLAIENILRYINKDKND